MSSTSQKKAGSGSGRNLVGLLRYLRPYPWSLAVSVGLLLVNIGIEMSLPQVIGAALTHLERHQQARDPELFEPRWYLQIFVSLVLVRAGVGILLGPVRNRMIQNAVNGLRADLYDSLQRLAFRFHDRTSSGELISRSTTDMGRVQDFFFACVLLFIDIVVALVVTAVLIFRVDPVLGLLACATMVPTVSLIAFFAARLQPRWRQLHDLHGAMTTVIQENIAGVRVVKAFAREDSEIARFRGRRDVFLEKLLGTVNYWAARVPLAQFVFGLSTPLVLGVGGVFVIGGKIPVGDLAKVVLYLMAIGHRLGLVGQFTNIVQTASASAERIFEIIHEPRTIVAGVRSLPRGGGSVEFRNVSFRHAAGETVETPAGTEAPEEIPAALDQVNFRVEAGQTVAVVGPTGSGKSTLVSLLPRFHDPLSGQVLLDGVDVREFRLHDLRRAIGFIFQETFLFSATVAENIAYGRPDATPEEIEQAARAAQAHEFIARLEGGYATMIGERGVSLSGGQRQRVAIARAFLMNPRVLILDDATASVDAETERMIREATLKLSLGRTTFVIAQRVSTVRHADLILVVRSGTIVERGTHEVLLKAGGYYREVFEHQIRG